MFGVELLVATSCEKNKEDRTETQNPHDTSTTDTTVVNQGLDPYMDSIYRSIPDPDTSVRSSMDGFDIHGRWYWKSRYDTVCSMILDFDQNGKIYPQWFKSDHTLTLQTKFSNCFFAGYDSCTYTLRNDTLLTPLGYWRDNDNVVQVDTLIDPTTLTIPWDWGVHKITLFNNQKVMYLRWTGYYGWEPDCEKDFYLIKQEGGEK